MGWTGLKEVWGLCAVALLTFSYPVPSLGKGCPASLSLLRRGDDSRNNNDVICLVDLRCTIITA